MALNHLDVNDREVLLAGVGYTGDYYWFIAESA